MEKITERNVAGLWRSGLICGLEDDLGNEIQVIHPGRDNTRAGCDFQDAVIEMNGERIVGDVEIHVTSDLWLKHGHGSNPLYNGIILHAAMWQRGGLPVKLQNGRSIPTVILHKYLPCAKEEIHGSASMLSPACPHRIGWNGRLKLDRLLCDAGMQRFQRKSERFSVALQNDNASQILYKAICRALGYSRNTAAFEKLADRLPLSLLEQCSGGDPLKRKDLIFDVAGLLSSQIGESAAIPADGEAGCIGKRWRTNGFPEDPMKAGDWRPGYVRPGNSPMRRLAGLSRLLGRFGGTGLLAGLALLIESAPRRHAAGILEKCLNVEGDVYPDCRSRHKAALIGKGRAGEMAVNAVLPFFAALARCKGDEKLERKVEYLYRNYRSLPGNELTRYMQGQLTIRGLKLNACRQQGLLHIYHSWCRIRDCRSCPVFTGLMPGPV